MTVIFAVVALSAALLNSWIYWLRRSEPTHLWLSVAALGTAGMALSIAQMYIAPDPQSALFWHQSAIGCSTLLVGGFPLFACALLDTPNPRLVRVGLGLSVCAVIFALLPGQVVAQPIPLRQLPMFNTQYYAPAITGWGALFLAAVGLSFLELVRFVIQNRAQVGRDGVLLSCMMTFWCATGLNDIAVAVDLYQGPLLTSAGYAGFLASFSAILVRRMTESMTRLEEGVEQLNREVETRTEELRECELQLAQGEKMATLGTLAAGVAMEINAPIDLVSVNVARLESLRGESHRTSEVRALLDDSRSAVKRIQDTVSRLLSMSNRPDEPADRVDLREVVRSAIPLVRRELQRRARLDEALGSVPPVLGDARELGQVVLNLLINAVQAIPEGHPDLHYVRIETSVADGQVRLAIRDTGRGIPEEARDRIFDPFFSADQSDSEPGLGLPVANQLVQRHRGAIEVESGPGGTTVVVTMPAAPAPVA
jgi:signal transduction histidine kinase